ncbi:MAG: hypothetical protein RI966_332 [Actinomycetota bacterium]
MADEEEIEVEGPEDIVADGIESDDLGEVEIDIDAEELIDAEDDLEVDPDALVVDPLITDEGSQSHRLMRLSRNLPMTMTTTTTFVQKTMLKPIFLQFCKRSFRHLKKQHLMKRKKSSVTTEPMVLNVCSLVVLMKLSALTVSCLFGRTHQVALLKTMCVRCSRRAN